jgi:hypothetical protein
MLDRAACDFFVTLGLFAAFSYLAIDWIEACYEWLIRRKARRAEKDLDGT